MATVVLSLLLAAAPSARAAAPVPRAACVEGSVAVFDVSLSGKRSVRAPKSRITGGRAQGRLPSGYRPGTTRKALRVRFTTKRVTWRLGRRTATLERTSAPCTAPDGRRSPVPETLGPETGGRRASPEPVPTPIRETTPAPPLPPADAPFAARSIFAATSFWNAAVPEEVALAADTVGGRPVNPTVGAELAAFAKRRDGSTNTWINYRAFTAPITTVPANAPLEPVRLCRSYPSGCVPSWAASLDRTLRGVARNGTYLGGGVPVPEGFVPPDDSDAEAIFYQPTTWRPTASSGGSTSCGG